MNNEDTNTQTIDAQVLNQRKAEFQKDLAQLSEKHRIVVVPLLDQSPFGIMPVLQLFDKDAYEKQVQQIMAGINGTGKQ